MFTKAEAKKPNSRGSCKVAVNKKYGMVAAGWLDGNQVHIVSTADTEQITEVRRKVGGKKVTVRAPEAIQNYNRGMDGVDRHDQYRAKYSLCKYHGFKKYYVKLYLSLLDMCVTNAILHNKIVHGARANCGADFIQSIATILMSASNEYVNHCPELREAANNVRSLGTTDDVNRLFCNQARLSSSINSKTLALKGETTKCLYDSLASYRFNKNSKQNTCQICSYEKRGDLKWKNVLVCRHHRVWACGVQRPPRQANLVMKGTQTVVQDYSWILGDTGELTCMEKFHTLYLPKGLFSTNVPNDNTVATTNDKGEMETKTKFKFCKILRKNHLYQQRQKALGMSTNAGGRTNGSKNKKLQKKTKSDNNTREESGSSTETDEDRKNNKRKKRKESAEKYVETEEEDSDDSCTSYN